MIADRQRITELLPHGPDMVLLDRVLAFDDRSIDCATETHRNPANPLRRRGKLPALAAVEYAAQAAALHAALSGKQRAGASAVLGGVKDVLASAQRLDDIGEELAVHVTRLFARPDGAVYSFSVGPRSGGTIVEGRLTVMHT